MCTRFGLSRLARVVRYPLSVVNIIHNPPSFFTEKLSTIQATYRTDCVRVDPCSMELLARMALVAPRKLRGPRGASILKDARMTSGGAARRCRPRSRLRNPSRGRCDRCGKVKRIMRQGEEACEMMPAQAAITCFLTGGGRVEWTGMNESVLLTGPAMRALGREEPFVRHLRMLQAAAGRNGSRWAPSKKAPRFRAGPSLRVSFRISAGSPGAH